jgi:uncharacterized protein (DUF433 family)
MDRITFDINVMVGEPCIRGMRVTVGVILGLMAKNYAPSDILKAYPYLEAADIQAALLYATWRVEEQEITIAA